MGHDGLRGQRSMRLCKCPEDRLTLTVAGNCLACSRPWGESPVQQDKIIRHCVIWLVLYWTWGDREAPNCRGCPFPRSLVSGKRKTDSAGGTRRRGGGGDRNTLLAWEETTRGCPGVLCGGGGRCCCTDRARHLRLQAQNHYQLHLATVWRGEEGRGWRDIWLRGLLRDHGAHAGGSRGCELHRHCRAPGSASQLCCKLTDPKARQEALSSPEASLAGSRSSARTAETGLLPQSFHDLALLRQVLKCPLSYVPSPFLFRPRSGTTGSYGNFTSDLLTTWLLFFVFGRRISVCSSVLNWLIQPKLA